MQRDAKITYLGWNNIDLVEGTMIYMTNNDKSRTSAGIYMHENKLYVVEGMGMTIDVPTRWRGVGGFPAAEYPRQPSEIWTGVWVVPMDAQPARLSYTVTATDRFGRMATFSPFINVVPQLAIVAE